MMIVVVQGRLILVAHLQVVRLMVYALRIRDLSILLAIEQNTTIEMLVGLLIVGNELAKVVVAGWQE